MFYFFTLILTFLEHTMILRAIISKHYHQCKISHIKLLGYLDTLVQLNNDHL